MVFQSFHQTWKPLQPKEPVLQPKHVGAVPAPVADTTKPLVPAIAPVAPTKSLPVVEVQSQECSCPKREWYASPWLSLGLAIGVVVLMMWAVSIRMDNAWLMKQHTQLMFNLLETLRT